MGGSLAREKLIKIGAKVISHGRYVTFQMAEVAIPRHLLAGILRLIADFRPPPDPTGCDEFQRKPLKRCVSMKEKSSVLALNTPSSPPSVPGGLRWRARWRGSLAR